MRCYFGHTLDFVFNLGKELIARYYGEKNVLKIRTASTKGRQNLTREFRQYLLKLP